MGVRLSIGSLLIAWPSFGSATAKDAFFSSLIESNSFASIGVTFPSIRAATSSSAVAALSNFWKVLSFNLQRRLSISLKKYQFKVLFQVCNRELCWDVNRTYILLIPSADSACAERSSFLRSFLSLALKSAYPALVSVSMKSVILTIKSTASAIQDAVFAVHKSVVRKELSR